MQTFPIHLKARALKATMLFLALCTRSTGYAQLTLTLAPSNHNGYNISCFGAGDGAIDLSVSGGTPPYFYDWSNGATTQDISNLRAGYYEVRVRDSGTLSNKKDITLTEPRELDADVVPYLYGSGFNISCFNCFNGSIAVTSTGGVQPYTYAWADGPTVEDRTQLDAGSYQVTVYDANSCHFKGSTLQLTQPERDDWTKSGNAGTIPGTHFFGTTDNKDVVFKSNGVERLRLTSNGGVKVSGLAPGLLRAGVGGELFSADPFTVVPCAEDLFPFWRTGGNFLTTCEPARAVFGSKDARNVNFITNNDVRMRLTSGGQLQVGGDLEEWPESDAAGRVNILQGHGNWLTLKTFPTSPGGPSGLWGLHNPPEQDRLIFMWHAPDSEPNYNTLVLHTDGRLTSNQLTVFPNGKVSIGDVPTNTTYEYQLYVGGGILTERVKVALQTSTDWSDHVFKPGYRLMALKDVASFIARNGHLPDVPSASEMVASGNDLGKTDAILLAKVEELTLYVLQLQSRIQELEKQH